MFSSSFLGFLLLKKVMGFDLFGGRDEESLLLLFLLSNLADDDMADVNPLTPVFSFINVLVC